MTAPVELLIENLLSASVKEYVTVPSALELEEVAMEVPVEIPSLCAADAKLALRDKFISVMLTVRFLVTVLVPSLAVRVNE